MKVMRWALPLSVVVALCGCQLSDDIVALAIDQGSLPGAAAGGEAPRGGSGSGGGGAVPVTGGTAGTIDVTPGGSSSGGAGYAGEVSVSPDGVVNACEGPYALVDVPLPSGGYHTACVAELARDRLAHALCACGDLTISGDLQTDAYDSRARVTTPGGASVGINGAYPLARYARVDGSFTLAGGLLLTWQGMEVTGDLRLTPGVSGAGKFSVGRDAWLERSLSGLISGAVGRDLYLDTGVLLSPLVVNGETRRATFDLDKPCRCEPEQLLDIAGLVEAAAGNNDNEVAALATDSLADPSEPIDLTLGCGRYYLSGLKGTDTLKLKLDGHVALFVRGNVAFDSVIELQPGAELDWFIDGNLAMGPNARLGETNRAGAVRVYVGGTRSIELPRGRFAGNLYAPEANVELAGQQDVYGSIFGKEVRANSDLNVHYDRYVLAAGEVCPSPPAASCDGCDQCRSGLTCIDGQCAACESDADCCSPLACTLGRCQPLLSATD